MQKELELTKKLQKLCETRWYCKHSAVNSIKHNYSALLLALERIKQFDRSPSVVSECEGLLSQIGRLKFILIIEIWEDLLSSTFSLSEYLQKDIFDVTQACGMITAAIQAIKNRHTDEKFYEKLDLAVELAVK